jgi:hypothetical protein
MSYKVQSPRISTGGIFSKIMVHERESSLLEGDRNVHILRSWYEYDSQADPCSKGRANWNVLLGIAIVATISAGFWGGVGLIIARLLR